MLFRSSVQRSSILARRMRERHGLNVSWTSNSARDRGDDLCFVRVCPRNPQIGRSRCLSLSSERAARSISASGADGPGNTKCEFAQSLWRVSKRFQTPQQWKSFLFSEILAQGISPIRFLPALPVRQPWQGGLFFVPPWASGRAYRSNRSCSSMACDDGWPCRLFLSTGL